jgi:hypothetical protein
MHPLRSPDRSRRAVGWSVLLVTAGLLTAACGGDDSGDAASTSAAPTTTTTSPTTTADPVDEDDESVCDTDELFSHVDETLALARLVRGGAWITEDIDTPFTERTTSAEDFADLQGLDCAVLATQGTDDGDVRLLLAAWSGPRVSMVVQATDGPDEPYEQEALYDVAIEWARGEHLQGPFRPRRDDRTTWAATMPGGETIVVSSVDYSQGATAKNWPSGFEQPEPQEFVSLDAERHGIDRLQEAGARNVDLSEFPEFDSEIGNLQFVSPTGQLGEARVAPVGWIDPTTEWHLRPVTVERMGGVDVYLSESGPPDDEDILTYDLAHLSFECDGYVWQVMTSFGTVDELRAFVETLISSMDC